jgi:hypothetical protein
MKYIKGTRLNTVVPVYIGITQHKKTIFKSKAFDFALTASHIPRIYPLLFKNKLKESAY